MGNDEQHGRVKTLQSDLVVVYKEVMAGIGVDLDGVVLVDVVFMKTLLFDDA